MQYKAILFDMDGTLLPMDNDVFTMAYFKGLCRKLAHYGMEAQALIDAVWTGTKAMVVNEFHEARACTGENPLAKKAVLAARAKAEKVVLATNPLFPLIGQKSRMSWVGLSPEDFDLVTSYESDSYCKPNPEYFRSVCKRIGVAPEECLLIGNDETEDMYAGSLAGMDCYLVTDCMISSEAHPWTGAKGTFTEMVDMLCRL
jgi:HAD superfamily hydrolase (TIGR01509 family)